MRKIFACIFYGLIALVLAWFPVLDAIYVSLRYRVAYKVALHLCWKSWILTLEQKIA